MCAKIETPTQLPNIYIDKNLTQLIRAIENYKYEYDEKRKVFRQTPLHDWSSDAADAFRYMAVVFRYQLKVNNQRIGYPNPLRNSGIDQIYNDNEYDAKRYGLKVRS